METLLVAALTGGVSSQGLESFISDEYEDLVETKILAREQPSNEINSIPYVVVE